MAKPLQSIAIQAPAFFGLNTQDSPTDLTEQFALIADNCVIDRYGRVGARKGYKYVNNTTNPIVTMHEHINADGTSELISATDSAIYKGVDTLTDITPVGYTVTDGEFNYDTLNDITYIVREDQDPLYYDGTTCDLVSNHPNYSGTIPQGDIVLGAFGRLWIAKGTTVYFSDLLLGMQWDTGSSGSINVDKVWKSGGDTITGLAMHNNFLFIFGERQIVIYSGASDPATMQLADTINNIGCLSHKTIQPTGNDLIFLSETGVRSINRTIQEKSAPIGDLSKNVRNELTELVQSGEYSYKSVYSPDEAFYLLIIEDSGTTYCFDMRAKLQDGSARVTKWDSINPNCALYYTANNKVYIGKATGIAEYDGYVDGVAVDGSGGSVYQMAYFSSYLDFGASSNLKLLKNLKISVVGGNDTDVVLNWGYDYSYSYKKRVFTLASQKIAEYGIAEYGIGEYNAGILVNRPTVNASGGGQVVQIGIEANINDAPLSIQRMTAQAIIGRVI
jgi:hypothetical protein